MIRIYSLAAAFLMLSGCYLLTPAPNHVSSHVEVRASRLVLSGYLENIDKEREIKRKKYFLDGIVVRQGQPVNGLRSTLWVANCFPEDGDYWTRGTELPDAIVYGSSLCGKVAEVSAKEIETGSPVNFSIGIVGMDANNKNIVRFSSSAEFKLTKSERGALAVEETWPR